LKLKVFTLRFSGSPEGFDDRPLQEFIADKEVIEFSEHFFTRENTPYITILIAYRALTDDGARRPGPQQDPRNEFDSREKEAYDALRTWRAAAAKMEGIPPYMIANNKQLAKMIKMRANSRESLSQVGGIGEAKVAKYGEKILEILGKVLPGNAPDAPVMNEKAEP
jgi:superfamily II DNA helicase RecQ